MSTMEIECPHCGSDNLQPMPGAHGNHGMVVTCSHCRKEFDLKEIGRLLIEQERKRADKTGK